MRNNLIKEKKMKEILIAIALMFTPVAVSVAEAETASAAYRSNTAFRTTNTYPSKWRYAPLDSRIDSWGNYNRQCVSYAAWKLHESGRKPPKYWGDAQDWIRGAKYQGIKVSRIAKAGTVGITTRGEYGHAVYVHKVKEGWVYISQYNAYIRGGYTNYKYKQSSFNYIYFTERR